MSDAELLKYDIRARERLLRQGANTPEQIRAYLDALPDLADRCDALPVDQPALLRSESERHARAVEPAARMMAPAPEAEDNEPPTARADPAKPSEAETNSEQEDHDQSNGSSDASSVDQVDQHWDNS